jgi:hypothetical protein
MPVPAVARLNLDDKVKMQLRNGNIHDGHEK